MRRPIFLDRDGVINIEPSNFGMDYVTEIKYFKFLSDVFPALRALLNNNYDIYIISNQAGVNKKIFSLEKLNQITNYMLDRFKEQNIEIKAVKYCIHTPQENCNCRKPKTQLLEECWSAYKKADKSNTFFIGDQERDIQTAINFGIKSILVLSGKTKQNDLSAFQYQPDYVAENIYAAVKNIILK